MSQWINLDFDLIMVGGIILFKYKDYCKCNISAGVYTVNGEWGYWLYCDDCDKPIEDEYHNYDDPVLY